MSIHELGSLEIKAGTMITAGKVVDPEIPLIKPVNFIIEGQVTNPGLDVIFVRCLGKRDHIRAVPSRTVAYGGVEGNLVFSGLVDTQDGELKPEGLARTLQRMTDIYTQFNAQRADQVEQALS